MVPHLVKNNRLYPYARIAALSLWGRDRFYGPITAISQCGLESEQEASDILGETRIVRREGGLAIWHTRLGELATTYTECREHVAFLVGEFWRGGYRSGLVEVRPGAIVLDIGANIGLFTRQAVKAGAQRVVCMEPAPDTLEALRWNLRSEIAANSVSVVAKGAWSDTDRLRFTVDPRRPGRSSIVEIPPESKAYEITIDVQPIDKLAQDLDLPQVDFIKMDIEGAEVDALKGATEILRRYKPQLAIAVEHTADPLRNARMIRELVRTTNPAYHCEPGRYVIKDYKLVPEILYFR